MNRASSSENPPSCGFSNRSMTSTSGSMPLILPISEAQRATLLAQILVQLRQPSAVLVVGGFEEGCGTFRPHSHTCGQFLRRVSRPRETFGDFGLDGVDEHYAADGGAGGDGRVEPVDLHHRVAD